MTREKAEQILKDKNATNIDPKLHNGQWVCFVDLPDRKSFQLGIGKTEDDSVIDAARSLMKGHTISR